MPLPHEQQFSLSAKSKVEPDLEVGQSGVRYSEGDFMTEEQREQLSKAEHDIKAVLELLVQPALNSVVDIRQAREAVEAAHHSVNRLVSGERGN